MEFWGLNGIFCDDKRNENNLSYNLQGQKSRNNSSYKVVNTRVWSLHSIEQNNQTVL